MGEVSQRLKIRLSEFSRDFVSVQVTSLEEIKAALAGNSETEWLLINYTGTEDLVLTEPLTVGPGRDLNLSTHNAGLTIAAGGKLTLEATASQNAQLVTGDLVIESGGELTTNTQSREQSNFYWCPVNATSITVESGGKITSPEYGFMSLNLRTNDNSGTIYINEGAQIDAGGLLSFSNEVQMDGTLTLVGQDQGHSSQLYGYVEFGQGGQITGSVTVSAGGTLQSDGALTVAEGGSIALQSGWVDLRGAVENNGTLTVNSGTLKLRNMESSVTNRGEIAIAAGARVYVVGTTLVNSGTITGPGELRLGVADRIHNYNDGTTYITVPAAEANPSNYSRYTFSSDPDATAQVTFIPSVLSPLDGGTCTAVVNTEEIPVP